MAAMKIALRHSLDSAPSFVQEFLVPMETWQVLHPDYKDGYDLLFALTWRQAIELTHWIPPVPGFHSIVLEALKKHQIYPFAGADIKIDRPQGRSVIKTVKREGYYNLACWLANGNQILMAGHLLKESVDLPLTILSWLDIQVQADTGLQRDLASLREKKPVCFIRKEHNRWPVMIGMVHRALKRSGLKHLAAHWHQESLRIRNSSEGMLLVPEYVEVRFV